MIEHQIWISESKIWSVFFNNWSVALIEKYCNNSWLLYKIKINGQSTAYCICRQTDNSRTVSYIIKFTGYLLIYQINTGHLSIDLKKNGFKNYQLKINNLC